MLKKEKQTVKCTCFNYVSEIRLNITQAVSQRNLRGNLTIFGEIYHNLWFL